jgi:hypothetical protein
MINKRERKISVREKVGFAMVDALEGSYARWRENPTIGNRNRYLRWRLRLRLRFNDQPELLERLSEEAEVGLLDEEVGPLYDTVQRELY